MSDPEPLPLISESDCAPGPESVPVFNCIVILSRDGERIHGRIANLAGITAAGNSERDVLMALSKRFKNTVQKMSAEKQAIPWIDPPEKPQANEFERFIPVHL